VSDRGSKRVGLPDKRRMRHDRHFVDELSERMGEGIGKMVRVTSISSNQDQPRTNLGDLTDLIASIEKHGVLEPLLVRRRNSRYELISGERRFHAAMQVGLTEIPCIELEVDDDRALEIALVENLQRQDLTAFEEAEGFSTLIDKYSYTHEQVAAAVGRSRVTVTESLNLLKIPAEVREACRHADISAKGVLLEIAKARRPPLMHQLIREIAAHQLDRDAIRERRKRLCESAQGQDGTPQGDHAPAPARPYRFRFKARGRPFSVSVSFRTEREPDPNEVIAALEAVLAELRSSLTSAEGGE
jgi:ParB family chromosome partitioning protein